MTAVPLDAPGSVRDENAFDPAAIMPFLKSQIADQGERPTSPTCSRSAIAK